MSNRITLVPGTSSTVTIALTDQDGETIEPSRLAGAVALFVMRTLPTDTSDLLRFMTPDPVHLVIKTDTSKLVLSFTPTDTTPLVVGVRNYQVELSLVDGSVFVPVPWTPVDVSLGGAATPPPPVFDNTVKIDHDYGSPGTFRYVTAGGSPIEGAQVRLYFKQDFDAGLLDAAIGITTTDSAGQWKTPILVKPGYMYLVQFFQPGNYGPDNVSFFA